MTTPALYTADAVLSHHAPAHFDALVEALADESGVAGDLDMVAVCRDALAGDAAARMRCAEVIAYANDRAAND